MKTAVALVFFFAAFVMIAWYFPCNKLPESWCSGLPWCEQVSEEPVCEHVRDV